MYMLGATPLDSWAAVADHGPIMSELWADNDNKKADE